ncbi:hypothetical protein V1264_016031 [Littorina saxatilis]|uniref:Uncharacterized protein n=1 Tax=Littorina saxatilis TaxID=31220 RepID=A0AAN9BN71_9CAEN
MAGKQPKLYVKSSDTVSVFKHDGSVVRLKKDEESEDGNVKHASQSVEEIGPKNETRIWTRQYDPSNPSAKTGIDETLAHTMLKDADEDEDEDEDETDDDSQSDASRNDDFWSNPNWSPFKSDAKPNGQRLAQKEGEKLEQVTPVTQRLRKK